jgi:hypothetical protein
MASVILELLEAEGQGMYLHGKLCFPEWAPEVRERVRNTFASALCASTLIFIELRLSKVICCSRSPAFVVSPTFTHRITSPRS